MVQFPRPTRSATSNALRWRAQRDADNQRRRADAAARAGAIWNASPECNGYPYLTAKHIEPHGARLWRDKLVVPVLDVTGELHSLQLIDQAGGKRFLTDGRTSAGCYPIGELDDRGIILIAEGFATAATLHEATDYPAVAAFNAGNLPAVAQAIRTQYPAARIIIAADDDHQTKGNPGLTKAREAAATVGAAIAVPDFGPGRPERMTDFNDLGHFAGHDRVRAIIDAAASAIVDKQKRILTGGSFIASFVAPDWRIGGIVQRGRLYACTSRTGHGKTSVWLYNACMIQSGRKVGHLETEPGNVLILAGENPEDLKARMLGMTRAFNLDPKQLPFVLPATFPLTENEAEALRRDIAALGVPFALIIGDTAASFFPGDNENDNVQAGQYGRTLRTLTACDGNPAVVALCHPIKNASSDSLLPRGGGAFLNEVEGNLTLWSDQVGETTTLHWQGKIRGPDFDALTYRLKKVETGRQHKNGHQIETIVAQPIDDIEAGQQAAQTRANEDAVLAKLRDCPNWSMADIARSLGWIDDNDKPERWRVQRAIKSLAEDRLVRNFRSKWRITDAGKTALGDEP